MPITNDAEVPVLIAGGGPAGLTTALTLARYGIAVMLVERRDRPSNHPKATVLSTRSMELIRSWGLEKDVLVGGVDAEMLAWSATTLADPTGGIALDVGYPSRAQALAVSPTAPACVPQDHLESVLHEHVRGLPVVDVRSGVEVVDVDAETDPVRVVLADRATGEQTIVHARYVIGAEGARSVTRDAVGITMTEPAGVLMAVRRLFHAPLWSVLGDRRYGLYFTSHPDGAGAFFPTGGDRWLFGVVIDPDSGESEQLTDEAMLRRIHHGSGVSNLDVQAEPVTRFTSAAQLADTFRRGNVFVAGDAAHRVTPRGGTGLNMAMRGAFDLAWKLAWVLRGWAGDALLDTYEEQQRPAARHNVDRSVDPNGSQRDHEQELRLDLGGRIPHAWTGPRHARVSTVDLVEPGLTLFTGTPEWVAASQALRSPVPVVARPVDETTARVLSLPAGGALLVRPDGQPVARWSSDEPVETVLRVGVDQATGGRY